MERELPIPVFLTEDEDAVHERMLSNFQDVSTLEGDFIYDATRPTAEQIAELKQLGLQNNLKIAFPQTSYGTYLEWLGECKGVFKNQPTKATGVITFTGMQGTIITKGTIVTTIATDEKQSIEFELLETKNIGENETVDIKAECRIVGTIGNVAQNTTTVLLGSINGIKSVTNKEDFKGGTDIEDEEHFRERVLVAEQEDKLSGASSDYIRWAKEVNGVGYAYVVSEWAGPGTVKVLILDKNRKAATQELIDKVQEYIYPLNTEEGQNRDGKAPIGAIVTIATPQTLLINVKASFVFSNGFSQETVLNILKNKIDKYLDKIDIGGTVSYNAIYSLTGSMMLADEGIQDFSNLTINDGTTNIILNDQVVGIGEIINEVIA
ncbi:TPA: baseplate J/gp47 family protein [Clostridioides difficile]|uniref:baseplate J/gp47 family protein n=1 Tax=Clostridioides difficile TaxID=1496 RepID=UPI00038D4247|nr:baseplate J/gp47 family protein [Clostridioides difficile]EQG78512.1 baseplate J-like family protein [Clostridioides difficile DA00165]EAA0008375.1 baseplate J/gp47 family protein [Clostridioides difficile]EGT3777081.1 baseplate J/gp47 family protein [Clostridioides difficile]EGT3817985.1 baseplate J/gp47 family protein [Clostridioides difficile]EGT3855845.1 baseplate J/gp47 family protein [Clostridioides difficile]